MFECVEEDVDIIDADPQNDVHAHDVQYLRNRSGVLYRAYG